MTLGFSVGIIPMATQKDLIRFYDLPKIFEDSIDLALRADPMVIDLVLCNENIVLFKATVGRMPLLDRASNLSRFKLLWTAIRQIFNVELLKYQFTTPSGRKITTAASGCMILHHHKGSIAARMIAGDSCVADGSVSTVVSAPISVVEYIKFLFRLLSPTSDKRKLPSAIGYLKAPAIEIEPESEQDVFIDGEKQTTTPIHCEAKPAAVRINVGKDIEEECVSAEPAKERIEINHLPRGKELIKAQRKKTIPVFSYASEGRFRDLFSALREDSEINSLYLVLMVLSTMLAAAGLYLDSSSVIIGAMLLAPLMAPIVSLSMGLLRGEEKMVKKFLMKIIVGIAIALTASTVITLLFPHKPVTGEMQARLNPTLLDLAVAIISGIAAAYSKSYKEIIQSLAGVAIAVALVPPLAVAGTGIGRGDFHFFSQAFLLFSTNLIGIIAPFSGSDFAKGEEGLKGVQTVIKMQPLLDNGDRIEILTKDDQDDPVTSVKALQDLVETDQVSAVVTFSSSGPVLAMGRVANKYKTPILAALATHPDVSKTSDYVSQVCFDNILQGKVTALFVRDELLVDKVAVFQSPDSYYSSNLATEFTSRFTSLGGEITDLIHLKDVNTNISEILTNNREKNPELLYLPVAAKDVIAIIQEIDQMGWKPRLMTSDGLLATVFSQYHDQLELLDGILATDFFHNASRGTPFSERVVDAHEGKGTSYTAMGVEGFAILLNALNRCVDPAEKAYISTGKFARLRIRRSPGKHFNRFGREGPSTCGDQRHI